MARAELVVLTNAVDGQDAAFNAWYDDVHLGEVCAVPGVVSARRSRAIGGLEPTRYRYLAIYVVEHDDPPAVFDEIRRQYQNGTMVTTMAMADDQIATLFAPLEPAA